MISIGEDEVRMEGVSEYNEGMGVTISRYPDTPGLGRIVVNASNEGGFSGTSVDLLQLLDWLRKNMPELLS